MTEELVRLDLQRRRRIGMVEAIWGEHKTSEQIYEILRLLESSNELALVTRVDPDKAKQIGKLIKNVKYLYSIILIYSVKFINHFINFVLVFQN